MNPLRIGLLVVSAAAASACSSTTADESRPTASVRVINATPGPLDVVVDGHTVATGVPLASVSSNLEIMTPFPYQATSPYLQSTPGAWEVFVTPTGGSSKLATTGPVHVPSGQRRTVVLMDSAGVLRFRVIAE